MDVSSEQPNHVGSGARAGAIRVRTTKFPSATVVESSWPGSGQHDPDDLVSTIGRAVEAFGNDADLEIIVRPHDPKLNGARAFNQVCEQCRVLAQFKRVQATGLVTDFQSHQINQDQIEHLKIRVTHEGPCEYAQLARGEVSEP